jgi:hypothetical protein
MLIGLLFMDGLGAGVGGGTGTRGGGIITIIGFGE